jgi:predicted ATP-dependent endonuclease of OLD family
MIRSISFQNYKSFKDKTTLDLKPITVLVGTNSSGKSSIIKLLGLLNQSYTHPRPGTFLTYDGPVVDMGDFKTISHRNSRKTITIELNTSVFDSDELWSMSENDKKVLKRINRRVKSDLTLHFEAANSF